MLTKKKFSIYFADNLQETFVDFMEWWIIMWVQRRGAFVTTFYRTRKEKLEPVPHFLVKYGFKETYSWVDEYSQNIIYLILRFLKKWYVLLP
jgi:hypothetical protein